ncbi:hypothetical protein [Nesterenkonia populi]|uniref:hypothetical protein n=1 Tax=Nesterenkonia populi TaxID=1591087 RepID=UPI0011BF27BC|nr:hypothetical protein [Nesterenkonia populi]
MSAEMSIASSMLRGVLIAASAVGAGVLAHAAAGQHSPHAVVVLLAMTVAVPVSTALASVRLSRLRLAAAVLLSQAVLHGLFALFPAAQSSRLQAAGGEAGHAHHPHVAVMSGAADHAAHQTDATMVAAHLIAAAGTYAVLRRGELILAALSRLLGVEPAALGLDQAVSSAPAPRLPQAPEAPQLRADLWCGEGPCTVRGPPAPVK